MLFWDKNVPWVPVASYSPMEVQGAPQMFNQLPYDSGSPQTQYYHSSRVKPPPFGLATAVLGSPIGSGTN